MRPEVEDSSSILFNYICTNYTDVLTAFNETSDYFSTLVSASKNTTNLLVPQPLNNSILEETIKFLTLAALTFSHQTLSSLCHSCRIEGNQLHIVWNDKISSCIKKEMTPLQLTQFLTETKRVLFSGKSDTLSFQELLFHCRQHYSRNIQTLEETVQHQTQTIHKYKQHQALSCEELFTLINFAPNSLISLIYNQLSQEFDYSLHINTPQSSVSIKSLLEQQSDNLIHNFEKVKAHFNLCFFHTDSEFRKKNTNPNSSNNDTHY